MEFNSLSCWGEKINTYLIRWEKVNGFIVCVCRTDGEFASGGPLSIRHRVRIVETPQYTVEKALLAIGHENIYGFRMNEAVEAFLREEWHIYQLAERGLILDDLFVAVSLLFVPATRVTVLGVPSFIPNEVFKKRKFGWFGKFSAGFEAVKMLVYNMSSQWDGRLYVSQ